MAEVAELSALLKALKLVMAPMSDLDQVHQMNVERISAHHEVIWSKLITARRLTIKNS